MELGIKRENTSLALAQILVDSKNSVCIRLYAGTGKSPHWHSQLLITLKTFAHLESVTTLTVSPLYNEVLLCHLAKLNSSVGHLNINHNDTLG